MNSFNESLFPSNFIINNAFTTISSKQAIQQFPQVESYELNSIELEGLIDSGELTKTSFTRWYERNDIEGYQEGSEDILVYKSVFFFSKNAILLKELKSKIKPADDEILVFIEDNTGDSSGQKHYVSIGKNVRDNLKKNLSYVNFDFQSKKFSGTGLFDSNSKEQLYELIKENVAEWDTLDVIWFYLKFTVKYNVQSLTSGLDAVVDFLEGLKLQEEQWNPDESGKRFKPYFFPLTEIDQEEGALILKFGDSEVNVSDLITSGSKVMSERLKEVGATINLYSAPLLVINSGFTAPVLLVTNAFVQLSIEGAKILEEIMQFFQDVIANGIIFINALLCGFVNSIIEAIAGIFFLISLIVKGITGLFTSSDWDEYMDNFVQAMLKVDFGQVWQKIKSGFSLLYEKVKESIFDFFTGVSFASVGYLIGYLIGMVVEFIITAGSGTVKSILTKTSKTFAGIVKKIVQVITRIIGLKKGASSKEILSKLISFLKKGTNGVLNLFDELIRVISNWIDEFKSVIKYSVEVLKRTARKANYNRQYTSGELLKIIFRARKLKLSIEEFIGFIMVGNRNGKRIKFAHLLQQMDNYVKIIKKRGYPFKFRNLSEFKKFSKDLLSELKKIGIPIDDVRIQGSSLRSKFAKDIDLAVFLDDKTFNGYLKEAYKGKIKLNGKFFDISGMSDSDLLTLAIKIDDRKIKSNGVTKTFARAIVNGKISAKTTVSSKRIIKGHRDIIDFLNKKYPNLNIEDISVQKYGGKLELKPDLKL